MDQIQTILDLPTDVLAQIFKYTAETGQELLILSKVCHDFNEIVTDNLWLWQSLPNDFIHEEFQVNHTRLMNEIQKFDEYKSNLRKNKNNSVFQQKGQEKLTSKEENILKMKEKKKSLVGSASILSIFPDFLLIFFKFCQKKVLVLGSCFSNILIVALQFIIKT